MNIIAEGRYKLNSRIVIKYLSGFFALLLVSLYVSFKNYLLFHTIIELFSIIIAFTITAISLHSYHASKNKLVVFLGIAYGFIGSFDLLHTLAFKGMGVFPNHTADLPTQLWIMARYIEAFSVLALPYVLGNNIRQRKIFFVYCFVSLILLLSVFRWDIFPSSFIEGQGLTSFKIISEYIICGIIGVSIFQLYKIRDQIEPSIFNYLILALFTTILTELFFTLYTDVYGITNMLGHVFKAVSFSFIYQAIIKTSLHFPYLQLKFTTEVLKQEISEKKKEEVIRKSMENDILKASKLDSIATLAGGIAHDFNNLLTIILGQASLSRFYVQDNPKALKSIEEIEKATQQATGLTQQLLTFSKGGEPIKNTEAVDGIIQETLALALSGSNVIAQFNSSDDLGLVDLDKGQFKQVINNLAINACQAMPKGGVLKVDAKNISIGKDELNFFLNEGKYVKITIEDHGIGISPENLSKIFDPFFTTKSNGHGLGLASCFSIIKRHNGYITVKSKEGIGTTFYIYLPISTNNALILDTEMSNNIYKAEGKILIMDDEEAIRDVAEGMLTEMGYAVDFATNGREALNMYMKSYNLGNPYDIVILDLTIPGGMGGNETARKIFDEDESAKIIISSGYSDDKIINPLHKNLNHFLKKPYTFEELSYVIHSTTTQGTGSNIKKII
ncbi:response regulator [Alkalicella caledoniensis]|uniref:Stage 0 sporulation protein A homolog n=1 Tax=Alkalicella caledoniensis TaxID=2731377 RepID=A0A7G9W7Q4_ALKCA|nr:MASE3 domain-containing protein [Alkalicella caledoniensis]QNO14716.1 response regulator [Alkalicella caledoniensis]